MFWETNLYSLYCTLIMLLSNCLFTLFSLKYFLVSQWYTLYFTLIIFGTKWVITLLYHKYILISKWVITLLYFSVGMNWVLTFCTVIWSGVPKCSQFIVPYCWDPIEYSIYFTLILLGYTWVLNLLLF